MTRLPSFAKAYLAWLLLLLFGALCFDAGLQVEAFIAAHQVKVATAQMVERVIAHRAAS